MLKRSSKPTNDSVSKLSGREKESVPGVKNPSFDDVALSRSAVDSLWNSILMIDREGRVSSVFTGDGIPDRDEFTGRSPEELFGSEIGALHRSMIEKALTGEDVNFNWTVIDTNGVHEYKTELHPVSGPDNEISQLLALTSNPFSTEDRLERIVKSRSSFHLLTSLADVGIWSIDAETHALEWSDRLYEIYDLDPGEPTPTLQEHSAYMSKADFNNLMTQIRFAFETGERTAAYYTIHTKKGHIRNLFSRGQVERDKSDNIVRLFGITQDITEVRRLEAERNQCNIFLDELIEQSPTGIQILTPKGDCVRVNQTFKELWGLDDLDFDGYNIFDDPQLNALQITDLVRKAAKGKAVLLPPILYNAAETFGKGNFNWIQGTVGPIYDDKGVLKNLVITQLNISGQQGAEAALRRNEQQFQGLFENSGDAILIFNESDECLLDDINPVGVKMFGYERAELVGRSLRILHDSDERYLTFVEILKTNSLEGTFKQTEWPLLTKSGEYVETEIIASALPSTQRLAFIRDITERKRAEHALWESENRFRKLFEHMNEMVALYELVLDDKGETIDYRILDINASFQRLFNLRRADVVGKLISGLEDKEIANYLLEYVSVGESTQASTFDTYNETLDKYLTVSVSPLGPNRFATIIWDITELVLSVRQVQENEKLLRESQRIGKLGNWTFHLQPEEHMFWSDEMYRIYGLDPSQSPPSAEGVYKYIHPDDHQLFRINTKRQRHSNEREIVFTYRLVTANGEIKHVRHIATPVQDESGKLVASFGILQDITEQVIAFEQLRQRETDLREAQRLAKVANWTYPTDGRPMRISDEMYRIFELEPGEFSAHYRDLLRNVYPDDRHIVVSVFQEKLPIHADRTLEYRLRFENDRIKYVRQVIHAERDVYNRVIGYFGTIQDITEEKNSEQERRILEAKMQQAQKLESLGVLAGGIAHDFNNILMAILGNADLALSNLPKDTEARENVERILAASNQAADLTQQMLAYSGKGKYLISVFSLSTLVEEMKHILDVSISKNTTLKFELNGSLPSIKADVNQLRQIVMNLVVNAAEALDGEVGDVVVKTSSGYFNTSQLKSSYTDRELPAGTYVILEVSDTGIGMNEETRKKLFDPFFTTKFTGRGLGLAAVLGIVRGHNASITVYSEPGQGTTFRVYFPASEDEAVVTERAESAPTKWKGSGTVLIADDELVVRNVARQMLEFFGLDVVEAKDGLQAIKILEDPDQKIDCILLDLTMPNLDGEGVLQAMAEKNIKTPVILSSGYSEQAVAERMTGQEPVQFIQKPYQLDSLRDVLSSIFTGES